MPASLGRAYISPRRTSTNCSTHLMRILSRSSGTFPGSDWKYVKYDIYSKPLSRPDKPLVWLHGEVRSPPFSPEARREAGFLLRRLQLGETLSIPHSRPMMSIGSGCHELRIVDRDRNWRIVYHVGTNTVVLLAVFSKTSPRTPPEVIRACQQRLRRFKDG